MSSRRDPDLDAEREVDLGRYLDALVARWWLPVLGLLIGVVIGVRKRAEARPIRIAAWSALGIVTLQILVAAAMVEMHLPASLRSIHQAIGTALWISVAALAALASGVRYITDIERIVYESPSRGEFATPEGVST